MVHPSHPDHDLWKIVQQLIEGLEIVHLVVWMPAHLDEPGNEKKLQKFFKNGGMQYQIEGNQGADAKAKQGAEDVDLCTTRHAMAKTR